MILVTGGTGLIGSHLLFELTKRGKQVKALKRSKSNISVTQRIFDAYSETSNAQFSLIQWVEGDVVDYPSLCQAMDGVDEVYHCAAMVSFNKRDFETMLTVNVQGTANMVDAALEAKVQKLWVVSSVASLGNPVDGDMVNEDAQWGKSKGKSGYAVSKFRSEMEVWRGIEQGLKAVIVNPSVIIGPCKWDSGSGQLLGTLAKGFPFYTQGITGYVDVRDVIDSMLTAVEKELWGQRFVINGENISHQKVFELIAHEFGNKPPSIKVTPMMSSLAWRAARIVSLITGKSPALTRETAQSGHSITYYSAKKMEQDLGVRPRTIAEAVKNAVRVGSL